MTDTNLDQFSIGELAKELNITTRTIRYYEERGLIEPERGNGRQRIYTRRERGRLKLILRAKAAGFDLEEVKDVLEIYDIMPSDTAQRIQAQKLIDMTNRRIAEIDAKITELTKLRQALIDHAATLRQMAGEGGQEI
ncbi:MAG: MerR family transcriptional regulator [Anaerolineales bacterium]|nr:MerR family transcriptional regulator [Anaerolineales bacterium]